MIFNEFYWFRIHFFNHFSNQSNRYWSKDWFSLIENEFIWFDIGFLIDFKWNFSEFFVFSIIFFDYFSIFIHFVNCFLFNSRFNSFRIHFFDSILIKFSILNWIVNEKLLKRLIFINWKWIHFVLYSNFIDFKWNFSDFCRFLHIFTIIFDYLFGFNCFLIH